MINGSIFLAVIAPESLSMSAKIGLAPNCMADDEVAMNVLGVVIISSFSFRPMALYAAHKASEPLAIAFACFVCLLSWSALVVRS